MAYDSNAGISKLGAVISRRAGQMDALNPLPLDFGEIQGDYSLKTNTYGRPIPKGQYSLCRQLTLGEEGKWLADTHYMKAGAHTHNGCGAGPGHNDGVHDHDVKIPEKMRSLLPGDRVLVAWVQNEAVVIDIVVKS